jgi:hypothetical protein
MIRRQLRSSILRGFSARGILITLTVAAAATTGCSREPALPPAQQTAGSPAPASAIPVADRPPSALVQIGESAKSLFDAAYASDWGTAADWVRSLNESASALPTMLPKPDLVAQLQSRLANARQSVSMHQRVETMDAANELTRLVADLSADFQTQVPYEAVMLGYYGRQLELGIASSRPSTLTQANTDLRSTWNRIEPTIERRGHIDDARRFTDIVVRLEGARRPADFVAPTRAELAEADRIEQLFR